MSAGQAGCPGSAEGRGNPSLGHPAKHDQHARPAPPQAISGAVSRAPRGPEPPNPRSICHSSFLRTTCRYCSTVWFFRGWPGLSGGTQSRSSSFAVAPAITSRTSSMRSRRRLSTWSSDGSASGSRPQRRGSRQPRPPRPHRVVRVGDPLHHRAAASSPWQAQGDGASARSSTRRRPARGGPVRATLSLGRQVAPKMSSIIAQASAKPSGSVALSLSRSALSLTRSASSLSGARRGLAPLPPV